MQTKELLNIKMREKDILKQNCKMRSDAVKKLCEIIAMAQPLADHI